MRRLRAAPGPGGVNGSGAPPPSRMSRPSAVLTQTPARESAPSPEIMLEGRPSAVVKGVSRPSRHRKTPR